MEFFSESLEANDYEVVCSNYIWEMFLIVGVKNVHSHSICNVKNFSKAKGFGGFVGNKAGLGVTFSVYETMFTVFNVHLHAGQKGRDKRIEMMNSLIAEHKLGEDSIDAIELSDYAFIIGDFNFRMNTTYTEIIDNIKSIHDDMGLDEFCIIKEKDTYYSGFTEGK